MLTAEGFDRATPLSARPDSATTLYDGLNQPQLIQAVIDDIRTPDFARRYVELETVAELAAFEDIVHGLRPEAKRMAKAQIRFMAMQLALEEDAFHESLIDRQQRVGRLGHTVVQSSGLELRDHLIATHVPGIDTDLHHQALQRTAWDELVGALVLANNTVTDAVDELDSRKGDADFLATADAWANTPNSKHEVGEDGLGFNAGLVHFFEYRGDPTKSRRFEHIDEPMTVDGFMSFTDRMAGMLTNGPAAESVEAILGDQEGNRRFYTLLPDGEFVVGFQRPSDEKPRLTSVITAVTMPYFRNVVAGCLAGHDRGVLNKLGSEVHVVSWHK